MHSQVRAHQQEEPHSQFDVSLPWYFHKTQNHPGMIVFLLFHDWSRVDSLDNDIPMCRHHLEQ